MLNINGKTMQQKHMLSDGTYATTVEHFESVMNDNDFFALQQIVEFNNKQNKETQEDIMVVADMLRDLKNHIQETKRISRPQLIKMIELMFDVLND